jgi:apocytochrome f
LLLDQSLENSPRVNFPCSSTRSRKNSDIKYLTYPIYAGGNRGRGQVYPTGDKSNMNVFGATQAGQITEITIERKASLILSS